MEILIRSIPQIEYTADGFMKSKGINEHVALGKTNQVFVSDVPVKV